MKQMSGSKKACKASDGDGKGRVPCHSSGCHKAPHLKDSTKTDNKVSVAVEIHGATEQPQMRMSKLTHLDRCEVIVKCRAAQRRACLAGTVNIQ